MTDEKLIRDFLNKHFFIDFTDTFYFYDKFYRCQINKKEFKKFFLSIFDGFLVDGEPPIEICARWYKEQITVILSRIIDYLNECKLILEQTNWVIIDKENNKVTTEFLYEKFKEQYPKKIIKGTLSSWFDKNLTIESERLMGGLYTYIYEKNNLHI